MAGGSEPPRLMSFVSEAEVESIKQKRQEEWEKIRRPDQPLERPEVEDRRPLFERLREQKERKQMEWDEQLKLKNQIYKGLDDDESTFLNFVAERQAEMEAQQFEEEMEELKEYRSVAQANEEGSMTVRQEVPKPAVKQGPPKSAKSQLALLVGAVKSKRQKSKEIDEDCSPPKRAKPNPPVVGSPNEKEGRQSVNVSVRKDSERDSNSGRQTSPGTGGGALLRLSAYSDSDSGTDEA